MDKLSVCMVFVVPLMPSIRTINNTLRRDTAKANVRCSIELKTIPVIDTILLGLSRLEKWLRGYVNLPFVASLVVSAERRR